MIKITEASICIDLLEKKKLKCRYLKNLKNYMIIKGRFILLAKKHIAVYGRCMKVS